MTRVTPDRFLLVTGTAFGNHDLGWIRRHAPRDGSVLINDLTSGRACYALWGPRARDILASTTTDDVSDAAFPYLTARAITVGDVPVYALRVTYVGELGWELYAHAEYGAALWDTLWAAGAPHGMVAGGYRAIDALRLEKGYRAWAADITPEETPYEAGPRVRGRRWTRATSWAATRSSPPARPGPRKRLRCLVLDDPRSVCLGNEPVRVEGADRRPGDVRRLRLQRRAEHRLRLPAARRRRRQPRARSTCSGRGSGFEVAREPLFDPAGARIRS